MGPGPRAAGIFLGATIHDMAQVVGETAFLAVLAWALLKTVAAG